jgi:NDP-sugar pyrophosphorylase family protein
MAVEALGNGSESRRNGHRRAKATKAVVLAGGLGTRLAPFTSVLPKPLMPIGKRSILEVVVERLARSGIVDVTFCVGYLSHLIRAVFDNGAAEGLAVRYVQEEEPLGTAGPLRLVEGLDDTFVVVNGDVLTTLDYRKLLRYHRRSGNAATIAVHRRTVQIDYGVIHESLDGRMLVSSYEEKPALSLRVSMGIYVLEPSVLPFIPGGRRFDIPDLIQELLSARLPVGTYRYDGLWFDIGRREDYEQAVQMWCDAEPGAALLGLDAEERADQPHGEVVQPRRRAKRRRQDERVVQLGKR